MASSDSFFARGGPIGCLLIHGFSGNPAELRPLAEHLVDHGYTVAVPLLPGHGPTPSENGHATWHEWRQAVKEAHDALADSCGSIVLIGYSMGGALALLDATRRAPAALVLISVPTFVGDWRTRLLPIIKYVVRWWYPLAQADFTDPALRARILRDAPDADLQDPEVQAEIRRSVRIPTFAIDQFFRLLRHTRRLPPSVKAPALVVHGRLDSVALPICAEEIYGRLASPRKELKWFEASGHQLFTEPEGAAVIAHIHRWLERQVPA
jgi:carboxylesterase